MGAVGDEAAVGQVPALEPASGATDSGLSALRAVSRETSALDANPGRLLSVVHVLLEEGRGATPLRPSEAVVDEPGGITLTVRPSELKERGR